MSVRNRYIREIYSKRCRFCLRKESLGDFRMCGFGTLVCPDCDKKIGEGEWKDLELKGSVLESMIREASDSTKINYIINECPDRIGEKIEKTRRRSKSVSCVQKLSLSCLRRAE